MKKITALTALCAPLLSGLALASPAHADTAATGSAAAGTNTLSPSAAAVCREVATVPILGGYVADRTDNCTTDNDPGQSAG